MNEIYNKEKYQKHLKRHQEEIQRLIRNLSLSMNLRPRTKYTHSSSKVVSPHTINGFTEKEASKILKDDNHKKVSIIDNESNEYGKNGIDGRWQDVEGIKNHKFFVYSAYYDTRDTEKPVVRVIGVTRTKRSDKVTCRLYIAKNLDVNETSSSDNRKNSTSSRYEENLQSFRDVPASIFIIRENWNLKYSACFITCPLTVHTSPGSKERFIPEAVSIIPEKSSNPKITNRLPVLNSQNGGTGTYEVNKTDVGVCVKPIHFHYNKTLELLQFIELNRILGVTR